MMIQKITNQTVKLDVEDIENKMLVDEADTELIPSAFAGIEAFLRTLICFLPRVSQDIAKNQSKSSSDYNKLVDTMIYLLKAFNLLSRYYNSDAPKKNSPHMKMLKEILSLVVDLMRLRLDQLPQNHYLYNYRDLQEGKIIGLTRLRHFSDELVKIRGPIEQFKSERIIIKTKPAAFDSIIMGCLRTLKSFKKYNVFRGMEERDKFLLLQMPFITESKELKPEVISLFVSCSGCLNWDDKQIEEALLVFTPFIEGQKGIVTPLLKRNIQVFSLFFKEFVSFKWRTNLLFLLVQVVWNSSDEIYSELTTLKTIMSVCTGMTERFLFDVHVDFLVEKMMMFLTDLESSNPTGIFQTGAMFDRSLTYFNKRGDTMTVLPRVLAFLCNDYDNQVKFNLVQKIVTASGLDVKTCVFACYGELIALLISSRQSWTEVESCLPILEKLSGFERVSLFAESKLVVTKCLHYYHSKPNMVIRAVNAYSKSQVKPQPTLPISSESGLRHFLIHNKTEKWMRMMISDLNKMANNIRRHILTPEKDGHRVMPYKESILSLRDLLNLFGGVKEGREAVSLIFEPIAAILSQVVKPRELTDIECSLIMELFKAFVENLDLEALKEGDRLYVVCKDLRSMFDRCGEQVVQILHKLLVENGNDMLKGYLPQLEYYLQTEDPLLEEVNQCIKKSVVKADRGLKLSEMILRRSNAITKVHDVSVKFLMINVLQRFIERNYLDAMPTSGEVSPWVSHVISNLMQDIKVPDTNIRLAIAKCLGEIGAVDLSIFEVVPRLDKEIGRGKRKSNLDWDVTSRDFVVMLLRILITKGKEITDANSQNTNSMSIQRLLCAIQDLRFKIPIEKDFSSEEQMFCKELIGTKYSVSEDLVFAEVDFRQPVVHKKGMSYARWIRTWAKKLIKTMKEGNVSRILRSVAPLFISDHRICESLLPSIVFSFLRDSSINSEVKYEYVLEEFRHILGKSLPKEYQSGMSFDNSSWGDGRIVVTAMVMDHDLHMCAQQIFAVYDAIGKFLTDKPSLRTPETAILHTSISFLELSYLAFGCESYARALLYVEKYLMEAKVSKRTIEMERIWELLQKIYVALDEPDGVDGVFAVRKDEPSLMDQLLAHEANNRLQAAVTCCEKGVRWNPNEIEYYKKMIRSLLALDQVQNAYNYTKGAVDHYSSLPEWKDKMNAFSPFIVECSWKLSQWDGLKKVLADYPTDINASNTNTNIGQILSCIVQNKESEFEEMMDKVRIKIMNHVAAVVTESDAYQRIYKDFTKIHMLTDIEKAAFVFRKLPEHDAERFRDIVGKMGNMEGDIDSQTDKYLDVLFESRNSRVRHSSRSLEPILTLQRVLYTLDDKRSILTSTQVTSHENDDSIPLLKSWLKSAKIARKSQNLERCYSSLLEIENLRNKCVLDEEKHHHLIADITIERAKHSWSKGDLESKDTAIKFLSTGITQNFNYEVKKVCPTPTKITRSKTEKDRFSELIEKPTEVIVKFRDVVEGDESMRATVAKLKLLQVRFQEEMQTIPSEALVMQYKVAIEMNKKYEKSMFYLARHYDAVALAAKDCPREKIANQTRACQQYYQSLSVGCKYAYESLARLLHIWCELAYDARRFEDEYNKEVSAKPATRRSSKENSVQGDCSSSSQDVSVKANSCFAEVTQNYIKILTNILPSYVLYNCFSQLMSRLTHKSNVVVGEVTRIVTRIVRDYPDQTLWLLMATYDLKTSNLPEDFKPTQIISKIVLTANRELGGDLINKKFIEVKRLKHGFKDIAYKFLEPKQFRSTFDLSSQSDLHIQNTIKESEYKVLIPHSNFFKVTMPPDGKYLEDGKEKRHIEHQAFLSPAYIIGIDDTVQMYASLARPKRLSLTGSDGKKYQIIAKPKDDMRTDARTQEFFAVVNRLLKKDPESRKRQLSVRRFLVLPFGDNSGLIEYLGNLKDIKSILESKYNQEQYSKAKANYPDLKNTVSQSEVQFKTAVLPVFTPAVLNSWFMDHFKDASQWHFARNNFIRSNAVMSMVGYIIGLGDRHLENILLDTMTGEVVHVDFCLLFNKGETLQVPEIVPFRLTHNIIDAMGSTGFEGHFRRSCEVTLRVMRENRDTLMSVLYPFVCDPQVGADAPPLTTRDNNQRSKQNIILINQERVNTEMSLLRIANRLKGLVKDGKTIVKDGRTQDMGSRSLLPVSVSGQVNVLIEEATDAGRLARMFWGWASFL
jgi:serine/threonine-protein kinase ATR